MKLRLLFITITFSIFTIKSFSQGANVQYANGNFNTQDCDIFGSTVSVSGYNHRTVKGSVKFISPDAIALKSTHVNASTIKATIYKINYNFKANYRYQIWANVTKVGNIEAAIGLRINSTDPGNSSKCETYSEVPLSTKDDYSKKTIGTGINDVVLDEIIYQNSNYLSVACFPGSSSLSDAEIRIKDIQIFEYPPFILSQTNVVCGQITPVTITQPNPHNVQGITSYVWDLGSANNGWLYQGNPARQIINSGTQNSITLTPSCTGTLSNIKLNVTANGEVYSTISTINRTEPILSISGLTYMCGSTANYSLTGQPCNASVSWSVSPSGYATIDDPTSTNITLTELQKGTITLTATATSTTCQTVSKSMQINVGMRTPNYIGIQSYTNMHACDEPYGNFELLSGLTPYVYNGTLTVAGNNNTANISWSKFNSTSLIFHEDLGNGKVSIGTNYQNQEINIRSTATNVCGSYNQDFYVATKACGIVMIAPQSETEYLLSPNPTSDALTISTIDPSPNVENKGKKSPFTQVRISDVNGTVKRKAEFKTPQERATILVADLPPGQYFAHIFNGKEWKSLSFVKK